MTWLYRNQSWVPKWDSLSVLGQSKMIKSFNIWFVAIPVMAKLFENIESKITILAVGHLWHFTLELPFTWYIFYLCSVFFTLANVVYSIQCPKIIQSFKDFSDFKKKDNSYETIKRMFGSLLIYKRISYENAVSQFLRTGEDITGGHIKANGPWEHRLEQSKVEVIKLPEVFAYCRNYARNQKPFIRIICSVLYLAGICLLSYVFWENIIFVINKMIQGN